MLLRIVDALIALRVSEAAEVQGLDVSEHGGDGSIHDLEPIVEGEIVRAALLLLHSQAPPPRKPGAAILRATTTLLSDLRSSDKNVAGLSLPLLSACFCERWIEFNFISRKKLSIMRA